MSIVPGIDVQSVTAWLESHVRGAQAPFTFDLITGGHSNLTFDVSGSNGERYVLRRPPLGHVLASAHDMGREYRIISGLANSAVPVAPALGLCEDLAVNGAPFYVMGFVDGHVIRDSATAIAVLCESARTQASESIVDTMAAIHNVDLVASGLDGLGKHEGYIARQLRRWYGQWNSQKTRDIASVDQVHDALLDRIPVQTSATIVHGDYRLDNCMVDDHGNIVAVLDWEICTLGDPLADLGLLMVYWTGPGDEASAWAGGYLGARLPRPGRLGKAVRKRDGSRSVAPRLLRRLCVLEAGVHPRGRVRPLSRWCSRPARPARARALRGPGRLGRGAGRSIHRASRMSDGFTLVDGSIPELTAPTLVVMLTGWIDASGSAAAAMAALEMDCKARTIAVFDGDTFIDYRARRPTMQLRDGVNTALSWPDIEIKAGRDLDGNDVLLLTGPEPDMAWHRFSREVAELGVRLGVQRMVALGSYPFATPHTRPARLSISAPSGELVASLALQKS